MENRKPLLLVEAMAVQNDSGLGRHVRLFVESLAALRGDAEIRAVLPRGAAFHPPPGIAVMRLPARPYRVFCEAVWPALIAALRPKAVLCLGQSLPALRPFARYALLVPDAAPLEELPFPSSGHPTFNRAWMKKRIPRADCVIASTEFTRGRLQSLLGIGPERIGIVAPVEFLPSRLPRGVGGWGKVETAPAPPYFLAVGNVEPRKNYPGLLRAYALLAERFPGAPPLHVLGHPAWDGGETAALRTALGLERRVFFHGHVGEGLRESFLEGCTAFVSASQYEGFGLPLFEALRAGKACVHHPGGAQEEIAAGAALAVDCNDSAALAGALETLARDAERRSDLERKAGGDFAARWRGYDPGEALRGVLLPLLRG